jgi:hypothetical protein
MTDEFCWNLHPHGKFSVGFLYKAIIQSDIPVNNNKKIWKMKIPLKTKKNGWYLRRGVILTKDNLLSETGMEVLSACSVIRMRRSNTYSSIAALPELYSHSSK